MVNHSVILFGHGARDPQWAEPMKSLQVKLQSQVDKLTQIDLAFLELMEPDLPTVVEKAAKHGVTKVTVIPIFFGRGGHLKKDFPIILAGLRERFPHVTLEAMEAVGQWDAVWDSVAAEAAKRLP